MADTILAISSILAVSMVSAFIFKEILFKISEGISNVFMRSFTTSLTIRSSNMFTTNVVIWLRNSIEHHCGKKLSHFGVSSDIHNFKKSRGRHILDEYDLMDNTVDEEADEDDNSADMRKQLEPLQIDQTVYFFYKRAVIGVTRNVKQELRSHHEPTEVFTVTAYGTTDRTLLIQLLEEARKRVQKKPSKHINYYKASHGMGGSNWRLVKKFQPRTLSSVVLKEGFLETLKKDLEEFIESEEWYKERGIPYRRGYLLYGPPGCGKTSFVKAIAGEIGYDIHELQLSNRQVDDDSLTNLMQRISRKAVLLFEDVDAVFVPTMKDEATSELHHDGMFGRLKIRESKGSLSFSGLLNAIDGASSEENYILFMTTNHIEKLDSALIRPGRIDMRQLIDYPDEQQIEAFFRKFYPECDGEIANQFAVAVTKLKCKPSIAQIQGLFLNHKHNPEDNLLDVDSLIDICKSNADLGVHSIYL